MKNVADIEGLISGSGDFTLKLRESQIIMRMNIDINISSTYPSNSLIQSYFSPQKRDLLNFY